MDIDTRSQNSVIIVLSLRPFSWHITSYGVAIVKYCVITVFSGQDRLVLFAHGFTFMRTRWSCPVLSEEVKSYAYG